MEKFFKKLKKIIDEESTDSIKYIIAKFVLQNQDYVVAKPYKKTLHCFAMFLLHQSDSKVLSFLIVINKNLVY